MNIFKTPTPTYKGLDTEIESLISHLEGETPGSKEFNEIVEAIVKLDSVNHKPKKTAISKDAILAAAVSLLGIVFVINAETVGAITSKSFGMVKKV